MCEGEDQLVFGTSEGWDPGKGQGAGGLYRGLAGRELGGPPSTLLWARAGALVNKVVLDG